MTGDYLVHFDQPGKGVGKRYYPTTAGSAAVAVGISANAGDLASALGTRANASGTASVALGVGSRADKENAVAIGAGSTTDESATLTRNVTINGVTFTFSGGNNLKAGDQISFGSAGYERQLKNVAPGMVSAASTDAINGSQLYSVAEELTNIRKQTRYFSVNDAGNKRDNYDNDGATAEGAMAVGTAATATSSYAVAVGNGAAASGRYGMALGANAAASVKDTIAVGQNARANADSAVAIGKNAQGAGAYAVSVGLDSEATQDSAVAVGSGAKATAQSATAVGNDAKAGGQNAVSLGKNNNVTAANAAAIGSNNTVSGTGTYVLGANNVSTAANTPLNLSNATIIGSSNKVNANANVHLQGNANTVTRTHAVVMGSSNTVAGAGTANEEPAIAIGTSNIIGGTGHNAIAIGKQNNAAGTGSVAIGVASKTTHNSGVALGNTAQSINENGLAIGSYAVAGNYATAVGSRARAKQAHGLALGTTSFAGDRATAVGRYSAAHADSGVALGSDALVVSGAHGGLALGSGAVVSGQYSGAIGSSLQNNATAQAADRAINTRSVVGGANSYAIGNKNLIGNTSSDSFILGNNVKIGASNATLTTTNIAPARDTTPDRTDSITFGGVKAISGAVALGSNTKVEVSDGVALGKDSRASVSAGITGADPLEAAADKTGYAWTSTKAAVSVGNYENGNQQSRQITGVAAGQEDADAVNVAQLKAAGFKFTTLKNSGGTAENSRVAKVKNGDAIAFDAGKNMKLSQSLSPTNGETITFALEDDLKVSSITFPVDKTANPNAEDITLDNTQLSVNGTPYSNVGVAINALDTAVKAAKTKYYSVNDGGAEQDNHDNAGAEGEGALAAGVAAKAGKNYDNAVGYNAKTNTKAAFASSQGAMAFGSNTSADGNNAVAIGTSSVSEGDSAIAVGGQAEGTGATNIGYQANATGDAALSAGYYAKATAANATALGTQAKASKTGALAAGSGANAGGDNAVALGMSAAASQTGALAAGYNANAGAEQALALGAQSQAQSTSGIAIGAAAKALGSDKENNIAIGNEAQTESNDSIVIGTSARAEAEAENAVVLGKEAKAHNGGSNSVAIGKGAEVTADSSIALGEEAKATAIAATKSGLITAIGYKAEGSGVGSVALGASSATTSAAEYSTALGFNAKTGLVENGNVREQGRYAVAIGTNAAAQADYSIAQGANSVATKEGSLAIGAYASASVDMGVALGANSVANVDKGALGADPLGAVADRTGSAWTSTMAAVSVGADGTATRQITSVAAGTNDTDAVNVAQLKAAGFNLATSASDGQLVDNTAAPADKKVKNGGTVTVDAGKNIKLTQNGNTISVATKDEVVFDKVTAGSGDNQVVLGNDGVKVGGNTLDGTELEIGGKKYGNVNQAINAVDAAVEAAKTRYYSTNDSGNRQDNYDNKGATADGALAAGVGAAASGAQAAAVGYKANAGSEKALALGSESRTESLRGIAIGAAAKALGSGKENNIAIGYGAQTESNDSIVIGSSATAVAEAENAVVLGKGARAGDAANSKGGNNSVAIGKGATVTANGSIALGEDAKATAAAGIPEAGLITAVGYKTEAGGMGSVALGASAATTSNAQYSTALGYNARTGKTDNSGQAERGGRYATAVGSNSRAQADNSAAFGASAVAENTGSVAIGNSSRAAIDNAVALGAGSVANVAGGAEGVDPLGAVTDKNNTTWTSRSLYGAVSVGNGTTVTRQITSVAAGTNDTDAVNVAQLKAAGFNLATSASDGQAVDNTAAPADKKVQNGETVTVDAGKNIKLTQNGNTISVATKEEVVFDKVTAGNGGNQVVLGNDGVQVGGNTYIDNNGLNANDKTIANVAPGSIAANSKQAVNGGQIFGIADSVAKALGGGSAVNADGLVSRPAYTVTDPATGNTTTANNVGDAITNLSNAANKPLTFAGDSGNSFERKLGTTANIKGGLTDAAKLSDNNIGVVSDGSDTLTVKLAKEISIDKVTAGNSVLDNGGLTITPASGSPVSLTAGGLDNGGNKIANVAEGTADTDAANVAQLKKAAAAAANKVKAGENITVAEEQNPDGSTTYTVATAKDVNFDSVTSGDTVLNKDGVKVGDDVALTSDGLTAGGLKVGSNGKITGLEKGEVSQNSKEAVNGGQLYAQGEGVKNIIGGTTAYDPDTGAFTNADIGGTGKGSIHDAIAAVKGTADQGWNLSANGKNSSNVKPGETVDLNNSDGNIVISKTDDSDNVTFDLAKAVTVDSVTSGDTVLNKDGVKVGNDVALTSDGLKAGDVAVNKDGINAGNKAVTNVAAGKAGTDAVNVSQLSPIAAALGTTVDANGTVAAPVFTVTKADGSQYAGASTIQGALDNIGTEIQKPLTFAGDSGSSFERKLGTTANIKGGLTDAAKLSDNNIGVVSDGSDTLTVKLAKEISIDKVTAGNSVLDNGGLTITPASGSPVSLTAGGLDNGGNKIANVAEGTADTDAANVAQLKKAAAAAANKVKAGENITVAEEQNPDGSTTYTVATAKDVNFDSVTSGDTVLNKDGVKVGDDVALTSDGLTAGGLKVGSNGKITGLEKGEVSQNSKEAVNGGQLYAQGEGVKNIIGGTTAYDPDTGAFTNADIGGTGKGSIHDAIAAVKGTADQGWNLSANGKNSSNVKPGETVDLNNSDGNIVISKTDDSDNVTFDLAKAVTVDSVTSGDTVLNKDGVKVGNDVALTSDGLKAGDVAVNKDGINAGNKAVTNVAAGKAGTDAVNVSQLSPIAAALGTTVDANGTVAAPVFTVTKADGSQYAGANTIQGALDNIGTEIQKPLTFAGDSGSSFERKLGTTANIKGGLTDAAKLSDNNIGVVSDGSDTLTVKLAKEISIDKVTAGNSVLDNGGLTITPASGSPVSLTAGGLDNGGNKIANVAEGTADTDAANVAQLKKAAAAAANKVKAGENITVAEEQNPDGSTTYTVATAKDVNFDSVTSGDTVLNKDGVKVGNDVALTSDGLKAGGLKVGSNGKITGLEKGEVSQNSKEAVNGSQLYAQGEGVKNIIGGTTAYDPDTGAFTNADIGGTGKGSIHDAIAAVKGTADQGWNLSANGKNSSNVKPGETVDLNNSDGNIVISKTDDSDNVTFDLAKAVTVDSLTAGDTTVNNAGVKVGDDVALTSDGLKAGDVAVNKDGINAGNKAVTNVAAGKAGTDAVNVSQLSPIAAALGTTVDANGTVAAPVFTVTKADGSQYAGASTIQGALDNIGTEIQKPLTFAGDSGSSFERKLGTTANIKGGLTDAAKLSDNNIGVVSDGSDTLTVKLAKEISIDKVTAGNSVLDNGGLTITPASGSPVSLTAGGLDNGGNKIANVAEGTADTDAANVAQLKKAAAAAANKVKAGENITVAEEQNPDGSTTYTVATAKDVNFDSVTSGDTVLNKDGVKVGDDVALTSDGLTAGGLKVGSNGKITGLEKGEVSQNSKEAVNGGQLYAQGEGVKNIIGGTTAYDPDTGAFTNADIGGTGKGSIHDAIAAVNQAAVKAKTTVSAGDNIVVEQSQNADGSANYTVATAKEVNFDQVTAGSGESQVVLGNDGVKVGGNTYIDKDGLNANNKAVTNVAAGRIAEDSKEAVNGGQLYNTVTSVAGVLGGDAKVAPDGSVGMSNIGGTGKGSIHDAIAAVNEAAVKAKTTVSAGDNIVVEQSSNADGSTNYKVATAKDLTVETVKAGGTTVNGNGLSIAGGPSVTVDGVDAGGKKITNVADGEISAASTDAINGSQLYYTNEAINNVANYTVNMGNQLNRRIDDVENRSNAGTATAMAVAGLPQAYLPGKSMVAVAGGTYRGESGYAVGYSSISDNGNWVIKGSATGNSRGHYGATAGVGYQW
ncbi:YadA-like family protein [Neisseria musculi]|uniref:YadA-like family protein n=1 Tax=Neisseria musculi TaxID=1815583 RepID=UPI00336BBE00